MQPFLAMIIPVGGSQPPLGIWGPTDPRPTVPIAGPGRPPGWGMANDPGYGVPLPPTQPPPLVIWGPGDPRPTLPIAGWSPGSGTWPTPTPPPGTWGPGDPRPTLPIAGWDPSTGTWPKPELPPTLPDVGPVDWKAAWTPTTGWVVIGIPTGPVPTPSKA